MTLSEALKLLLKNEKRSGNLLEMALSIKRHCKWSNLPVLRSSDAFYLPAVNSRARIKWGRIFIRQIHDNFNIAEADDGPSEAVFLVTLAEITGLKTDQQQIDISRLRRKFQANLKGLSYVGMIDPGYYNSIYDESDKQQKNMVSWHGHFIVWGVIRKELAIHLEKMKLRFEPIMPGLCAVHHKLIEPSKLGVILAYICKKPRKEYSIGKRSRLEAKTGLPRYKQNSRPLRPGHRVKLFHLMRDMTLDKLAMGGGDGRELLRQIKNIALRDCRRRKC